MKRQEVILTVQLKVHAEMRADFLQMLSQMIERSRLAQECVAYDLFCLTEDENSFHLFQTWGTREAFETNWIYADLPKLRANSRLLSAPIQCSELRLLL